MSCAKFRKLLCIFLDKHNLNLLYKSLERLHIEYGNTVWSPFWNAEINIISWKKLNLPTLDFLAQWLKPTRYDANCTNSLFQLKESNKYGHKFGVKTKLSYQEPGLDKTFLAYR